MRPRILCFAGLDPSGGAGLQADIESISNCGGHALPIASCLTTQNSIEVVSITALNTDVLKQQVDTLLQDMDISACKIGVIPNRATADTIADIVRDFSSIPVVFDPVLRPTQGHAFSDTATLQAIQQRLLAAVNVITPNHMELAQLANCDDSFQAQVSAVTALGPEHILVTGGDQDSQQVHNVLYRNTTLLRDFVWPRLAAVYHGSGCTLSSALTCFLALGDDIETACQRAQDYTYASLKHAQALGRGQLIPQRNKLQHTC